VADHSQSAGAAPLNPGIRVPHRRVETTPDNFDAPVVIVDGHHSNADCAPTVMETDKQ
jgi:hypothetical protein